MFEPSREDLIRIGGLLWGKPTEINGREVRFGAHGSKCIDLQKKTFYDHEAQEGGGWIDLWRAAGVELPPRSEASSPLRSEATSPLEPPWQRPIAATYDYCDENGRLLCQTVRFATGRPRFMQRQPQGRDWNWSITRPVVRRVLYRLPELLASDPDDVVWLVEGEKDVDTLRRGGLTATTNIMGAGKWQPEYSEFLRGRHVAIVPDNDETGRRHAAAIDKALAGIAASSVALPLPGLAEKGDVSDWLSRGHTIDDLIELYRGTSSQTKPGSRILDGAAFLAGYTVPDWLIQGIVQRGRLYTCTSLTNHGKTAAWFYNACMVQAGREIAGLAVDQANVLYLAGENPADLQGRGVAMQRIYGLKQMPYVLPLSFPMVEEEIERLKSECLAMGIPWGLIVGDTAASFFPGDDENNNVQAAAYGRGLRSLNDLPGNPAVVMLAHPVKGAQSPEQLVPRGGGALLNEVDGNLTCWSESLGEITRMHWTGKIRGPNFDPVQYKLRVVETGLLDKNGAPDLSIIADFIDDFEAASNASQAIADQDAVLVHLNRCPTWSQADVAQAMGWLSDAGKPIRWKAQRAIDKLKSDRLVEFFRGKWRLTEKGKTELGKVS